MTAFIPLLIEAADGGELAGAASGVDAEGEEGLDQVHDLGNGNKLELNGQQFRDILHSAATVQALHDRAKMVFDNAKDMSTKKHAQYEILIQNTSTSSRARAFVRPANADAYYDNLNYSTLLKAMVGVPNDPRADGGGDDSGPERPADDAAGGGEEAAAGEGAEAGELAEVAIVAL